MLPGYSICKGTRRLSKTHREKGVVELLFRDDTEALAIHPAGELRIVLETQDLA